MCLIVGFTLAHSAVAVSPAYMMFMYWWGGVCVHFKELLSSVTLSLDAMKSSCDSCVRLLRKPTFQRLTLSPSQALI
jgi:hypothetical protein